MIERTYRASVDDIWSLWTTEDGFASWWGPEGFRVDVHVIEPRPGGRLEYDMVADTPEVVEALTRMGQAPSHGTRGRFSSFEPKVHLALTHILDFLPGVEPYESTIQVELVPVGDRVRMSVTLDPLHDEDFTRMQVEGFTSQLTKLDRRFGG